MKNNKLQQYSEEALVSGTGHLLALGVGAGSLAAVGIPAGTAFLASFAVTGLSFLGHALARGAGELYDHLSNNGKKLKLSPKNSELLKDGIQLLVYTVFFGLGVFAEFAALGLIAHAAPIALIAAGAMAGALALGRFAPDLLDMFRSLVGWKNSDNAPMSEQGVIDAVPARVLNAASQVDHVATANKEAQTSTSTFESSATQTSEKSLGSNAAQADSSDHGFELV